MAMGAIAVLTLGTMALGAYSSAEQAKQANRFRRQEMAYGRQVQTAQTRAAEIQEQQIKEQAKLEKQKTAREGHQIRSTLRVAAGEIAGLGFGGTYEALLRQSDLDQATNIAIIDRNAEWAAQAAYSRVQPLPPMAPRQNATLAALLGGLGGAQTGLSLGTSGMSTWEATRPAAGGTR